ncbi:hypothetical protein [Candidatus Mycoplasma haematominutum]|uniref:Uncharacterized protein n=1 Tax=Candidatus Mycoplasma haematominutum 'Birmingham 1' TaxID=1116213 RepID=G8C344_9MOLU|nr:hypothetical protein [Candidatus Mycoplasma haematominutum]CCE66742.1 hypothetical protein (homolog to MSU_0452) [Candidatus Mycoplasma haematominutum 'Birmingham 1']
MVYFRVLNFDHLVLGKITGLTVEGVLVTSKLFAPFLKHRSFSFSAIPGKVLPLPCAYHSLSEYYENWGELATSTEDKKYLLPTNWELVYSLLLELRERRTELQLPEPFSEETSTIDYPSWKSQIKQVLSSISDIDFHEIIDNYNQRVFTHPKSKLNFKLIHPEEIKFKGKVFPTIAGARNLQIYLNKKLEILPMFSVDKDSKLKLLPSWKLEELEGQTTFKYDQEWISTLESKAPDLFSLHSFKAPPLPTFSK